MEAISAGSSTAFKPAAPESQYEPVSPVPEGEMYSYARTVRSQEHHQLAQERKELKSLYDDPDAPIMIQPHVPSQSQPTVNDLPPSHLEHPTHYKTRRARSKSPSTTERIRPDDQKAARPPASPLRNIHMKISDDKEQYDVVDATASTETVEEYVEVYSPPQTKGPERSITVPKELSTLAETSVEDLSNINPNEAQLWMLNQMQKLVEKFAGVYEVTVTGPLTRETKSNRGKVLPAQSEEFGVYEDAQSRPPIPPRTYSCSVEKSYQEESSLSSRKISRQSKTVNDGNRPSLSSTERSPHHHSKATCPPLEQKPGKTTIIDHNII